MKIKGLVREMKQTKKRNMKRLSRFDEDFQRAIKLKTPRREDKRIIGYAEHKDDADIPII
jgi:hypothetical protein